MKHDNRATLLALADAIERDREHLDTAAASSINRRLALAGLRQARALFLGVDTLIEARRDDIAGILCRSLYETWLYALYALWGGDEARYRLIDNHIYYSRKLVEGIGETLPPWYADPDETGAPRDGAPLGVLSVARYVSKILRARGNPAYNLPIVQYEQMYRYESTFSAHGGLGTMLGHIGATTQPTPPSTHDWGTTGRLVVAAVLLANLASFAYDELEIDQRSLEPATRLLNNLVGIRDDDS